MRSSNVRVVESKKEENAAEVKFAETITDSCPQTIKDMNPQNQ